MSILSKHIPHVNEQIAVHEKLAAKFAQGGKSPNEFRYALHQSVLERNKALLADIEVADKTLEDVSSVPKKPIKPKQLQLTLEELESLPPELLEELSTSSSDKFELMVVSLINETGGIASLDHLIVGLFKKTGEIHKRVAITAKLYRMSQRGLIFGVPSKKGWYSTEELLEEQANELFAFEKLHTGDSQ